MRWITGLPFAAPVRLTSGLIRHVTVIYLQECQHARDLESHGRPFQRRCRRNALSATAPTDLVDNVELGWMQPLPRSLWSRGCQVFINDIWYRMGMATASRASLVQHAFKGSRAVDETTLSGLTATMGRVNIATASCAHFERYGNVVRRWRR